MIWFSKFNNNLKNLFAYNEIKCEGEVVIGTKNTWHYKNIPQENIKNKIDSSIQNSFVFVKVAFNKHTVIAGHTKKKIFRRNFTH